MSELGTVRVQVNLNDLALRRAGFVWSFDSNRCTRKFAGPRYPLNLISFVTD